MKQEKFDKELIDGIEAFLALAPTGILEQRFGLDLGDVTEETYQKNKKQKNNRRFDK